MAIKRWRYAALAVTAALALGGSLSGCSSTDSGKTTLSFLMWGDGGDSQHAYTDIFDSYEKLHPDIKINAEFVNTNDYDTVLKTRLSGGAGPDLYGLDPKNLPQFIQDGFVTDLSHAPFFSKLDPSAQAEVRRYSGGKAAYYTPISSSGNGIIYNVDLFAKAGITSEPTTYSAFVADCQKLKNAGIIPLAMSAQDSWWPQYITYYAAAEHVFSADPNINNEIMSGKTTFEKTSTWHDTLQIVKDLVPYYMPNPVGTNQVAAQSAFLQGKAAMFPGTGVLQDARKDKLNIGYMNFPTTNQPVSTIWGSYLVSWGINPTNGKAKQAEDLVSYFFQPANYKKFLDAAMAFPVTPGVTVSQMDPLYPDMEKSWAGKTYVTQPIPPNAPIQDALLPQLQNLIAGKATIDQVLKAMDDAVAQIRSQQ